MKKFLFLILASFLSLSLFAQERPEWVDNQADFEGMKEGYTYAVGESDYKNLTSARKAAFLDAQANMAVEINNYIQRTNEQLRRTNKIDIEGDMLEMVNQKTDEITKSQASAFLKGIKRVAYYRDPDENISYILIRVKDSDFKSTVEQIVSNSLNSQSGSKFSKAEKLSYMKEFSSEFNQEFYNNKLSNGSQESNSESKKNNQTEESSKSQDTSSGSTQKSLVNINI